MLQHGLFMLRRSIKHSHINKAVRYGSATGLAIAGITYIFFHPRERTQLQTTLGSTVRFIRCLKIGLTISVDYWIASIMNSRVTDLHQRAANRIVEGCLKNGGIFIKLGQGLSALNHILPKQYVDTLSILQDKCLTRGNNELEEIFLQDFGKRPDELFQAIEEKPHAAASLAQVYKAKTMNGDTVAIKIQYIDLQDRFISDIRTLDYLLQVITIMHPKFNLHWVLNELFETLAQELDFRVEGKNSERCASDLSKYKYAYVPKVYWDLSTKRILTTEWIDGIKISDVEKIKNEGLDIADVDTKLISLMAEQIFHTGFVHADPHPGNVLVRKGNDKKAEIVLLDHGLYEYLPESVRVNLCNFWESMVLRDRNNLKVYGDRLNVEDHILLAEMLTQAPYSLPKISLRGPNTVAAEEYMSQQARERFDKITTVLRSMPKSVMLVIRNLNIIRSITKNHGDIVDRYKLMARIAVSGKYSLKNGIFIRNVVCKINQIKFEAHLWWHGFIQHLIKIYIYLLQFMGYDLRKIIEMV